MEAHLHPSYQGEVPKHGLSMVSQYVGLIRKIGDGIRSVARAAILRGSTAALTDQPNARIGTGFTSAVGRGYW